MMISNTFNRLNEWLTDVWLRLIMRDGVLNWDTVKRSFVLSITYFIGCGSWNICLLNFAWCHTVVRLVNIEERFWFFFEDDRHGFAARFICARPRNVLLFKGYAATHAAFWLRIAVEATNFGLQHVQVLVVGWAWDSLLVKEHLISQSNALSLGDHIVWRLFWPLLPIKLMGVFARINYAPSSFHDGCHVPFCSAFLTEFSKFESILDFVIVITYWQVILAPNCIEFCRALGSLHVRRLLFILSASLRGTL